MVIHGLKNLMCHPAMASRLPTFATSHGGPAEMIKNGISGYRMDPYHRDEAAQAIGAFSEQFQKNPEIWTKISETGLFKTHIFQVSTYELQF